MKKVKVEYLRFGEVGSPFPHEDLHDLVSCWRKYRIVDDLGISIQTELYAYPSDVIRYLKRDPEMTNFKLNTQRNIKEFVALTRLTLDEENIYVVLSSWNIMRNPDNPAFANVCMQEGKNKFYELLLLIPKIGGTVVDGFLRIYELNIIDGQPTLIEDLIHELS